MNAELEPESWWVIALAWLGFGAVLVLVALVLVSELAPRAPGLRAWLHAFLFG